MLYTLTLRQFSQQYLKHRRRHPSYQSHSSFFRNPLSKRKLSHHRQRLLHKLLRLLSTTVQHLLLTGVSHLTQLRHNRLRRLLLRRHHHSYLTAHWEMFSRSGICGTCKTKASLSSYRLISPIAKSWICSSLGIAQTSPIPISSGSQPATAIQW